MTLFLPNNSAIICNEVYNLYKNLLDSYVSDFYLEKHWDQKLPNSWKVFLRNLSFSAFADLLDYEKPLNLTISPLAILCLRKILKAFCLTRKQAQTPLVYTIKDTNFLNVFWKNVKFKKRHEIEIMAQICYQTAIKKNCFYIVDVGSGLGHLSRMLAYQYGFRVCTFEENENFTILAQELDTQFEKMLSLKKISHLKTRPIHINKRIEKTLSSDEFISIIREAFSNQDHNFNFGIVGLHPCGNLGSTLLHLYSDCPNAAFINIASCCYMKLSLNPPEYRSFPLSKFYKQRNYKLDYLSCETACHAIENYADNLRTKSHCQLKIHSFRAALECFLLQIDVQYKHSAVGNVKYKESMTFKEYCEKAIKTHNIKLDESEMNKFEELIKNTWTDVVKFYSVRLLLAPIVESIILYDRLLYLQESNSNCDISPVFDCRISPRNHVLSALKV